MAKKRKRTGPITIEQLPHRMRFHIHKLGFSSIQHYKIWCRENSFSCGLNKDSRQRQNELETIMMVKASALLADDKKSRNLKEIIPKIYAGEQESKSLRNGTAKEIALAFERSNSKDILFQLLMYLEENSNLLKDSSYVKGIESIANHFESWLCPIETWQVKSHNRDRQFSDLLRHLFVAYSVPQFMERVWLTENTTHQNWYKHIGVGQNIRTAQDMPITLTKKMAHHFLNAPKQYSVDEALCWGQVHALGGDKRLMDALRGTRLIGNYENDAFWQNVIRFFIVNPMLDVNYVHPIVDFIWNQKFENQRVIVARGVVEEIDPPQPNFSMKGRTPKLLLRQMHDWHRQLGEETSCGDYTWPRCPIEEFRLRERAFEDQNKMRIWNIRELLSTEELQEESRSMKHCVRSYAKSCSTGKISIWTMDSEDEHGRHKLLTIEVCLVEKLIRQVRGKRNRLPNLREKGVLMQWASREDLKVAEYVNFE